MHYSEAENFLFWGPWDCRLQLGMCAIKLLKYLYNSITFTAHSNKI